MLTTLSLYGLLRHLLLGPAWGWYAFGGLAAGLGVITKGVGFLPLLVLAPYALLALRGWSVAVRGRSWRWASAPLAAVAATALWLVPLLIAARDSPELTAYRDEILLGQTVGRYVAAPGHWQPWWYFVGAVIPWAWAPVTLALPWLWPEWRRALRARDTRVALLLAWIALVVVFFSLSSGKRGVYVLPAVPALAIVTSPYVGALLRRAWLHRLAFGAVLVVALAASAGALYYGWLDRAKFVELMDGYSISPFALLLPPAVLALVTLVIARPRRGLGAFVSFMLGYWVVYGWWLWPLLDEARSGRVILQRAYAMLPADTELGVVEQKESLLLHADGAFTNFGHRRVDVEQERSDAARWLAAEPHRELLIRAEARPGCFDAAPAVTVGRAHGIEWQLVPHAAAVPACAARGRAANAIAYHAHGAPRSLSLASVVSAWRLR
jgi:4-amino-4-deoxy-L-arabinose transferase-like glycosyltransferase